MTPTIRRGQSVRWRMTLLSGAQPADMTGGTWGVAETSFAFPPAVDNCGTEAWLVWTSAQTVQMTVGRKRLRLKFTQANGEVKVFPDAFITVQ